jgi:hypothetical protein
MKGKPKALGALDPKAGARVNVGGNTPPAKPSAKAPPPPAGGGLGAALGAALGAPAPAPKQAPPKPKPSFGGKGLAIGERPQLMPKTVKKMAKVAR